MLSQEFMDLLETQMLKRQEMSKNNKLSKNDIRDLMEPLKNLQSDYAIYEKLFKTFTETWDRDWLINRYIMGGINLIEDIDSRAKPSNKRF